MRWTAKEPHHWRKTFAWTPTRIGDQWFWLEYIEVRFISAQMNTEGGFEFRDYRELIEFEDVSQEELNRVMGKPNGVFRKPDMRLSAEQNGCLWAHEIDRFNELKARKRKDTPDDR